jgi:hypothetical protein
MICHIEMHNKSLKLTAKTLAHFYGSLVQTMGGD